MSYLRRSSGRSVALSVSVTPETRRGLEAACEASGRSIGDEVEARLRDSLGKHPGDRLILLRLDQRFFEVFDAAHRALYSLYGDMEDASIAIIRGQLIKDLGSEFGKREIAPLIPPNKEQRK